MILLASANEEIILRWQQGLFGVSSSHVVHSYASLIGKIYKLNPQIVFLDYELADLRNQQSILELVNLRKETRIVIFAPELSDEIEWKLFKLGIKGCCLNNVQSEQIKRVVNAIMHDELWIRRTLTNKILNELVKVTSEKNQMERTINNLLDNLTRREYEIAMLVGRGESNKRIAQQLTITERTVKAHLTEIFRKLRISDRIKLALIMKDASKSV